MNDVDLEHRLTVIEQQIAAGFKTMSVELKELKTHVATSNSRLEHAENNIAILELRPTAVLSKEVAGKLVQQHDDMWSVWRFSRWFIPFSIPASIVLFGTVVELLRYWK